MLKGLRYKELTKDILLYLAIAGAITIAATSPYFLLNIAKGILRNKKYFKKKLDERKIARLIERLKRNRLIILNEEDGKFKIELTEKGKRVVKEIQFEKMEIERPAIWDGKWRVVIFDIPEKYRKRARDALREKLKKLEFFRLQKSVWVIPYPCEKEIQFLCELFEIIPFVNIIIAENIYNDIKLRKYFKLL
jgi:DNA-binding transcriptional regulator PaaX